MLTRLRIKNFKQLEDVDIELGSSVVLIGPNNSGKTTALQALALWDIGLKRWMEKKGEKSKAIQRSGVAINRNDLTAVPIPSAKLMWRDLHVRDVARNAEGRQQTKNVRIEILVEGFSEGKQWKCGLEFDYSTEEAFICRPMSEKTQNGQQRMKIPPEVQGVRVAFLPPMSGLAATEPKWEPGRIGVLIGEGQTAQVLRNLCAQVYESSNGEWEELCGHINRLFGVALEPPLYIKERGEITMSYRETGRPVLDISSSGRGLQQTLLLLAHLYSNPNTILLLDEPDAHLEALRQREIYQLLTEIAGSRGSQIVAASHSEVVLDVAARHDIVIAFVGKPHRLNDRGHQVLKSLNTIGFHDYYQAEQTGWILYLEGSTDLTNLQVLAKIGGHKASHLLERPFVHYVGNEPTQARDHFYGLREACPSLIGIAVFDRLDEGQLQLERPLVEAMWRKRELENYFCKGDVLLAYATGRSGDDLFEQADSSRRVAVMSESIQEISAALENLGKPSPWSDDIKASDDFLDPLFEMYFRKLGLPNLLRKSGYHTLATLVRRDQLDAEIVEKLDMIVSVANSARPMET